MKLLTRDEILKADDLPCEDLDVPEWGGSVRVKTLTGMERDNLEKSMVKVNGKDSQVNMSNFRAKLVAKSIIDNDGKRIFSDADVSDLGFKSAAALSRVFDVASRLSGFSETDINEISKNLLSGQSEDSGTA